MTGRKSRVLDLFCGAGGFSCGFEQAGYDVVAGIDFNEDALDTFEENHDAQGIQCDLSTETPDSVLSEHGIDPEEVDVVVGGPPCQGFSIAGKKNSDDERNELVQEYFEWIEFVEPEYFLMENVSGLLAMDNGAVIEWVLGRASELGYSVDYEVLDASEYGVPQYRDRLFVVGSTSSAPSIPSPTHGHVGCVSTQTQLQAFADGGVALKPVSTVGEALEDIPSDAPNQEEPNHSESTIERARSTAPGESVFGHHHQFKLDVSEPAHTVTASNYDFHPVEARGLTVREQARLQTFPDTYEFCGSRTSGQRQVGNAVPPRLARVLAESL